MVAGGAFEFRVAEVVRRAAIAAGVTDVDPPSPAPADDPRELLLRDVLGLDEDAFAKRSAEVKSAVDRYANLEVNYLLQRVESFGGVVVLTTNLDTRSTPRSAAGSRATSCSEPRSATSSCGSGVRCWRPVPR